MLRFSGSYGFLSALFLVAILLSHTGCGKKAEQAPAATVKPSEQAQAVSAGQYTFEEVLSRAAGEESFFTSLCRLVLTRSVLLAVDSPPAEGSPEAQVTKLSIKILKNEESQELGAAMLFSSEPALVAAGEKFGWKKNKKGAYSYAAVKGQAVFRILRENGYKSVVLDSASPHLFMFNADQVSALADGKIPAFQSPVPA